MKFATQEEINAPVAHVFAQVSDADALENGLRKRGGKIARSPRDGIQAGTTWDARVSFRGKSRVVTMVLEEITENECMVFRGGSAGMDLSGVVTTVALSPTVTRLSMEIEAKPKTLAARLLIQSAKLARGKISEKFKERVGGFADKIAKDFERS